jgi:microsomal dipeptidase-like Zn-dependent dipeptidase
LTADRNSAPFFGMSDPTLPRLVDLHAHYPMHFYPDGRSDELDARRHAKAAFDGWNVLEAEVKTWLLERANELLNYQSGQPRVTVESLTAGGVGVALSPLHQFFDEIDLDRVSIDVDRPFIPLEPHLDWRKPEGRYFENVLAQMNQVNEHIGKKHAGTAGVARDWPALRANWEAGRLSLVHAVEGGFSVGSNGQEIRANVRTLASLGVAYVTVAHLFYRHVATNAAALPFLEDAVYHRYFGEPMDVGLTSLGRAMVDAMLEQGIFVDLTHMSERAFSDTLALLDERDPALRIPVLATHVAYRFTRDGNPGREYNLTDEQIVGIARRKGLIGILLCNVDLGCNLPEASAVEYVLTHLERIADIIEQAGIPGVDRYDCLAIGTDLDGFIQPPDGIGTAADLGLLVEAIRARMGSEAAEKIASGNALRVLASGFAAHGETTPPGQRVSWAPLPY